MKITDRYGSVVEVGTIMVHQADKEKFLRVTKIEDVVEDGIPPYVMVQAVLSRRGPNGKHIPNRLIGIVADDLLSDDWPYVVRQKRTKGR